VVIFATHDSGRAATPWPRNETVPVKWRESIAVRRTASWTLQVMIKNGYPASRIWFFTLNFYTDCMQSVPADICALIALIFT
jgi:hypothetical protein